MKIIYDKSDLDGASSAAILLHRYGPEQRVELIGSGRTVSVDPRQFTGEHVVLVDLAMPMELMRRVSEEASFFVWIDHHATAIQAYDEAGAMPLVMTVLDRAPVEKPELHVAACELTWRFCYPGTAVPQIIRNLSRYDVWNFDDEAEADLDVVRTQYGARARNLMDPEDPLWPALLAGSAGGLRLVLDSGRAIHNYVLERDETMLLSRSFLTEFDGYRALALNQGMIGSLSFKVRPENKQRQKLEAIGSLRWWDKTRLDIMISFQWTGHDWHVSLRSENVDVGVVAQRHGGGGHRYAAGFHCDTLPFPLR